MTPDTTPLSKKDLLELYQHVREDIQSLEKRLLQTMEDRFEKQEVMLEQRFYEFKDEILDHFDAVAENIHLDVAGANKDQISFIKEKTDSHEDRIETLERHAGLRS